MGLKTDFTAYNGTQCMFHTITQFNLETSGRCTIELGAFRTEADAKTRMGCVVKRKFVAEGISPSELILHDLYLRLMELSEFKEAIEF